MLPNHLGLGGIQVWILSQWVWEGPGTLHFCLGYRCYRPAGHAESNTFLESQNRTLWNHSPLVFNLQIRRGRPRVARATKPAEGKVSTRATPAFDPGSDLLCPPESRDHEVGLPAHLGLCQPHFLSKWGCKWPTGT